MTSFPPPKLQYKLAVIDIQKHRQLKIALWRSCFMLGCILGLGFLSDSSLWKIEDISQVRFDGNRLVAPQTIHDALNFTYPQLIWKIEAEDLAQKVESIPSVEAASVNRQIVPPRLIVSLQERIPVAIATSQERMGFLDINGEWIEQEFYTNIDDARAVDFNLPKLIVHNYQSSHRQSWIDLYRLISLYPELKINKVQWNHSGNLFLQTKIGKVALGIKGTNSSRLEKQFEIMLKLQNLNDRINRDRIAYIDLSNPNVNVIQRY